MNLPAVMLFICFSTAYGLICKSGGVSVIMAPNTTVVTTAQKPVTHRECPPAFFPDGKPISNSLCIRIEYICSEIDPKRGTAYYCPNDAVNVCQDKKDGYCDVNVGTYGGLAAKDKLCCSSDATFGNSSSLFSSDSDKSSTFSPSDKPSSAFSTRALLAIITVLLGRFF